MVANQIESELFIYCFLATRPKPKHICSRSDSEISSRAHIYTHTETKWICWFAKVAPKRKGKNWLRLSKRKRVQMVLKLQLCSLCGAVESISVFLTLPPSTPTTHIDTHIHTCDNNRLSHSRVCVIYRHVPTTCVKFEKWEELDCIGGGRKRKRKTLKLKWKMWNWTYS